MAMLLGLAAAWPVAGAAQTHLLKLSLIGVHHERVYLALPDSNAVEPGQRLRFEYRGKPIATGEVERVYGGELAIVRLTSGSLGRVKHRDRLEVLAATRSMRPAPLLRVGYPSQDRSNLIFSCSSDVVAPSAYRSEAAGEDARRLIRDAGETPDAPWPDTLLIRFFDEQADQEIALERGELDVAVFWPGEPSARLREDARWRGIQYGVRTTGVIVAFAGAVDSGESDRPSATPDRGAFASLNRQLFRGDLLPWFTAVGQPAAEDSFHQGDRRPAGARIVVDSGFPGASLLERVLNPERGPGAIRGGDTLRLLYLAAPFGSVDSILDAAGVGGLDRDATGAGGWAELRRHHVTPLFAIRCPVFCRPEVRSYVSTLGIDAFVNLLGCGTNGRGP